MLTLELEDFIVELQEGTVKHVGTKTKAATVKLYHVETADARAFGDQVKLVFDDGDGNHVEVAVDADDAATLNEALAALVGGDGSASGREGEREDANDATGDGDGGSETA